MGRLYICSGAKKCDQKECEHIKPHKFIASGAKYQFDYFNVGCRTICANDTHTCTIFCKKKDGWDE